MYESGIYVDPRGRTSIVLSASTRKKFNLKNKDKARIYEKEDRIIVCFKESNKIEITEAQANLLKKLEDAAYSHYQDPYGKYCIDTLTRLSTIRECCLAIGIEREVVSENEDIGKERAFAEKEEDND